MRRFWAATLALVAVTALAMWTTKDTTLGTPLWQYNASFVVALVAAAGAWPLLRQRRFATLSMGYLAILATGTGFAMLYTREFPDKEWITWWHCFTSFALLLAFLAHWIHNHPRLWGLTKRLFTGARAAGAVGVALWVGALAAALWPALAPDTVHRGNYLAVSSWTLLAFVVATYGTWLVYRAPAMRRRLAQSAHRNRARGLVDASLFLAHWGALLTGFALLWIPVALEMSGLRYPAKWWHTATSLAFLAFATLHIGFNARLLAAHARRVDDDLTRDGAR